MRLKQYASFHSQKGRIVHSTSGIVLKPGAASTSRLMNPPVLVQRCRTWYLSFRIRTQPQGEMRHARWLLWPLDHSKAHFLDLPIRKNLLSTLLLPSIG